jgi:hypothetical protein
LTKRRNNFTDAKVPFSRYELIELLGWPQSGQSYRRIEESLHRWVGVVLMYENAWWDNVAKSWVDENFHVLDNVTLYDRERRGRAAKAKASTASGRSTGGGKGGVAGTDNAPLPLSGFRWNEVIFQSFQSGNLKQLDLEFYLGLRLPTTKRMFRFLDKRFYRRSRLEFDLRTLACEHIGMSRSYAPTELKRRLKPALEELEQLGFLEPLSPEERYSWVKRGSWRIVLIRGSGPDLDPVPPREISALAEALAARGVSSRIAAELVEAHPADLIQTKLEVFDWLLKNEDKRIGKNPAGYLVASVRDDYQAPVDFKKANATAEATKAGKAAEEVKRKDQKRTRDEAELAKDREVTLRAAWDGLSQPEREEIMADVKVQNPGLSRWNKVLERLCLSVVEARLGSAKQEQKTLFPGLLASD